jgi:GSCFA family
MPVSACTEAVSQQRTSDFTVYRLKGHRGLASMFREYQHFPKGRLAEVFPVAHPRPGLITRATRVGSIGSCFAQEIKKWLIAGGYTFLQTEDGPSTESGSARFGNVFNTKCIRQIFEAAYGLFDPLEKHWPYDGKLMDPYRKNVGWANEVEASAERASHHAAVRELVSRCEVLICTIGQAEVWRNRADKAAFFMIPPPEVIREDRHEVAVLGVEENVEHLRATYDLIRAHNPALTLVVTVSPVPLLATFQDEHALVADEANKAILRVAADTFCRANPGVLYFPAYEIVKRLCPNPWLEDNRHVRPEVVARVMDVFMGAYGVAAPAEQTRQIA